MKICFKHRLFLSVSYYFYVQNRNLITPDQILNQRFKVKDTRGFEPAVGSLATSSINEILSQIFY